MKLEHLRRAASAFAALALSIGWSTPAAAQAQPYLSVAFVSAAGDDASTNCTAEAPCKQWSTAAARVYAGGVLNLVGPLNIPDLAVYRGISYIATGNVTVNSLTVYDSADQQLVVEGINVMRSPIRFPPTTGIVIFGGNVTIRNCQVTRHSVGVSLNSTTPAKPMRVALDRVSVRYNGKGVLTLGSDAPRNLSITDSVIDRNATSALEIGRNGVAVLSGSTLSGSGGLDLALKDGDRAVSYGNNVIRSGAPTETLPLN